MPDTIHRPLVAVSGQPDWLPIVQASASTLGFDVMAYAGGDVVAQLADDQAALLLVDGARSDWQAWTAAPKASPATRRIPVVVVSRDPGQHQPAFDAGADAFLAPDALADELPNLLGRRARVLTEATARALDTACDDPLPPEALEGVHKFNAGEYYHQHDLFEALWMVETGPIRDLYRAILQVGIAYFQVTRGNRRGALRMLLRSQQWLAILPDVCRGVNIGQLRQDAAAVRAALEASGDDLADFDRGLLKPVRLVNGAPPS
jgi:predicted metal-dependent hydrolase